MWYDKGPLLSHNKFVNIVLSNRGGGKTFGFTRYAIDKWKKKRKQTVWVRRYQSEIDEMLLNGKFFDAVRPYYPNDELKIEGNLGIINGEVAIYFVALSTSRNLKSNNYPEVDLIVYDEFIIIKGKTQYLPGEVEVLLDLMETVFRMRDDGRVIMLANKITEVNPYFIYWNLRLNGKRFLVQGEICVECFEDADYIAAKKKTKMGRLVAGTRYGDYAIENKSLLDTSEFIEQKTPKAVFIMGLKYEGSFYGFWADYEQGYVYVNNQYDPYSRKLFALTRDDHSTNLLMVESLRTSPPMKFIKRCFQMGIMRFSDIQVKGKVYDIMGLFMK